MTVSILYTTVVLVPIQVNATSTSKYRSTLKSIINQSDKDYLNCSRGFLYDFDNNGTKELVTVSGRKNKNTSLTDCVVNVFTISKNKVKCLIKNKRLIYWGVQTGMEAVCIAKYKGKKYLMLYYEAGIKPIKSNFKLYNINGTKIKCKYTVKGRFVYDNQQNLKSRKITKNSKKITYKSFLKWQKDLKLIKATKSRNKYYPCGYKYTSTAPLLEDLYNTL